ncbi:MAG TPA: hypothetical protein PKZ32_21125 [Candidatus Melainabacteria bacterium]|nr:hypothetical protein [Candidatus Melainabacteria bacterium]
MPPELETTGRPAPDHQQNTVHLFARALRLLFALGDQQRQATREFQTEEFALYIRPLRVTSVHRATARLFLVPPQPN